MTRRIHKYVIPVIANFQLQLPRTIDILHLGIQDGQPCLWVEVDPNAPTNPVAFLTVGTGANIPVGAGRHVGTYQLDYFVWHVYLGATA